MGRSAAAFVSRRWPAAVATVCGALAVLLASSSPPSAGTAVVERHPPPVRSEDMLRRAGGVLWWVTGECRLYRDVMAGQRVDRAPGRLCRAWPSPDGAGVLATPETTITVPGFLTYRPVNKSDEKWKFKIRDAEPHNPQPMSLRDLSHCAR